MPLTVDLVQLSTVPLHPYTQQIMERGVRKSFKDYDAQRISFAFSKATGGAACLEIGPGRRDLTTMLVRSRMYQKITAIDIVDQSEKMPKGVDFHEMDVSRMSFGDRSFDTVYCLEVLEHMYDLSMESAIKEIRRVCRRQLIVTVPFREPANSPHHEQQFSEARIQRLFPSAKISLLIKEPNWKVPWVMIEEDCSKDN